MRMIALSFHSSWPLGCWRFKLHNVFHKAICQIVLFLLPARFYCKVRIQVLIVKLFKRILEIIQNCAQQQLIIEEIAIANKVQRSFVWTGHENNSWGVCRQKTWSLMSLKLWWSLQSNGLLVTPTLMLAQVEVPMLSPAAGYWELQHCQLERISSCRPGEYGDMECLVKLGPLLQGNSRFTR